MERGDIEPTGFGVTATKGQMDGAADFLIVEDVACGFADTVVHTEGEFANTSCSIIYVEHAQQVILACCSMCFDDTAICEAQSDVIDGTAIVAGRQSEANSSLCAVFDWTGIDF